jgi:hypothetical protein
MIGVFTRQIAKLHSQDGQALVFVAMVGLVIFLFFAMTMNVAELVNTKIKNQNVADAVALSAAGSEARALNLVSAANRNLVEFWIIWIGGLATCGAASMACAALCHQGLTPVQCLICMVLSGATCGVGVGAFLAAQATGRFQETVLATLDSDFIEADVANVVNLNYAFKPNTATDQFGHYLYLHADPTDGQILRSYTPGRVESGDYVLERAGLCETIIGAIRFANVYWHETDGRVGLPDATWQAMIPTIEMWFSFGGPCFQQTLNAEASENFKFMFPLAIRTRRSDWSVQNVETYLPISVATYKVQEPPPVLGKGSGAWDCAWEQDDTRFPCPNAMHYAFASAHAYSEYIGDFYNTQLGGISTPYPIPHVPFHMDWEPRLFPFEPYPGGVQSLYGGGVAYEDLANQIEAAGFAGAYQYLMDHTFTRNGMFFFLY